jgi:hypothetical protein
VLLSAFATIALTALEWLPAAHALPWSLDGLRVALTSTQSYSLDARTLCKSIWPLPIGPRHSSVLVQASAENGYSFGLFAGVLALSGAIAALRDRNQRGWLWLWVAAVVVALGRPLGLFSLMYYVVPGIDRFRVPSRALFLATLAAAMLVALGIRVFSKHRMMIQIICSAMLIELIAHAWATVPVTPVEAWHELVVPAEWKASMNSFDRPRIRYVDQSVSEATLATLGAETTDLYDWFQLEHAADLYRELYSQGERQRLLECIDPVSRLMRTRRELAVLERMAVKWLVHGPLRESALNLETRDSQPPRAYVVGQVQVAPDDSRAVEWMAWTDARTAVVMDCDPCIQWSPHRQPFQPAQYLASDPDRIEIKVQTNAPGILVVADTWMPGWTATLDGRTTTLLRGNRAQRVVLLPEPGSHRMEMRYDAPGRTLGTYATGFAWLAWCAAVILSYRKPARLHPAVPFSKPPLGGK